MARNKRKILASHEPILHDDHKRPVTRRDFLKTSSVLAAGAAVVNPVKAAENEKIRVALVGTGVRGLGMWGRDLIKDQGDKVEMVGICDINPLRLDVAKGLLPPGSSSPNLARLCHRRFHRRPRLH